MAASSDKPTSVSSPSGCWHACDECWTVDENFYARKLQVVDGEYTGMKGVQTAIGKYGISSDKPNRQDVFFTGIRIEADPSTDRQHWLSAMKEANTNMVSPSHCTQLHLCSALAVLLLSAFN